MPGPISKSVEWDIGRAPRSAAQLPTMVTVNLHLVDADTGAGIEADNVEWKTDEGSSSARGRLVLFDDEHARRTKESERGRSSPRLDSSTSRSQPRGYTPSWTERIDVVPGRSELTIRAARAMGVRIRVVDSRRRTLPSKAMTWLFMDW